MNCIDSNLDRYQSKLWNKYCRDDSMLMQGLLMSMYVEAADAVIDFLCCFVHWWVFKHVIVVQKQLNSTVDL